MILIDEPYVSPFLRETIRKHALPVVATPAAVRLGLEDFPSVLSEEEALEELRSTPAPAVHTVSENSIGWIAEHLAETPLFERVARLKNKARFREALRPLFPSFRFQEIRFDGLDTLDLDRVPVPFVIKPTVGFFSLGVHGVPSREHWPAVWAQLQAEVASAQALFPGEVLDTSSFLVEQRLPGPEFAFDAYFDEQGQPVVLSIFEHLFGSGSDTSDRVYVTSAEIVEANLERLTDLLAGLGRLFDLVNFAVHVEVRLDAGGRPWPIEVNPLRFGGWCTTADLTYRAFGLDPYAAFFAGDRPDWDELLRDRRGELFSVVVLGNTTGIEGKGVRSFDYEGLLSRFEDPIELRRTDYRRYPLFGFVFTRTRSDRRDELAWALESDLREFVSER